jgi:hypothetical protein
MDGDCCAFSSVSKMTFFGRGGFLPVDPTESIVDALGRPWFLVTMLTGGDLVDGISVSVVVADRSRGGECL